jgi:hypothetical protein
MKNVLIYSSLVLIAIIALAYQNFATVKVNTPPQIQKTSPAYCPYEMPTKSLHTLPLAQAPAQPAAQPPRNPAATSL